MPAPIDYEQLLELLSNAPSESRLSIIQAYLRTIADPQQRNFVQTLLLTQHELGLADEKQHIILCLHGIRSPAIWQERLRSQLSIEAPKLKVLPIGYARYPLLDFLGIRGSREQVIKRMRAQIESVLDQYPNAEISFLAHSFGTYILTEILKTGERIRLHRVLLCGSIVREDYDWKDIRKRGCVSGAITNDAGTRDYWPVTAAKLSSLGYGPSGFYGFKHVEVTDNFHNYGHSDFFTKDHLLKHWVPFLLDGQVVLSDWNMQRDNYVKFNRISLACKIVVFLVIPLSIVWWWLH